MQSVKEVKTSYENGELDDESFERELDRAMAREDAVDGELRPCDYCGEPMLGWYFISTDGCFHKDCIEPHRKEKDAKVKRRLALGLAVISILFLMILFL